MRIHSTNCWRGLLLAGLLVSSGLHAAEVAGVRLAEQVRVDGRELVLNGAGLRSKLFIKVYVAALYAPQKSDQAAELIDASGPRRISLRMLRSVGAEAMNDALQEGLAHNLSAPELAALEPATGAFSALMKGLGELREGDGLVLDFSPAGVAVALNDSPRGQVSDAAFARALLKVWLGDHPADADLKQAMLGG